MKAWPLAWAVVDQVYGHVLPALRPLVDRGWSAGNLLIDKPPAALNLVTGLMYVLGPVILTTAFGIAVRTLGQGLSGFTSFRMGTPSEASGSAARSSSWGSRTRDHDRAPSPSGRVHRP